MPSKILKDLCGKTALERGHVTLYIKNNLGIFRIQNYESTLGNLHDERWTIDEPEDYQFI